MRCLLCTLSLSVILAVGCGGDYYQSYLEEHAGFLLPDNTCNVVHFTGSDIAFTSHYTIPADSMAVFALRAGLRTEKPLGWTQILFTDELPPPWCSIPENGSFMYGTGRSNWNRWDILLDTDTGDLWATMYYTDASGDAP